jgi:hypothetical protein
MEVFLKLIFYQFIWDVWPIVRNFVCLIMSLPASLWLVNCTKTKGALDRKFINYAGIHQNFKLSRRIGQCEQMNWWRNILGTFPLHWLLDQVLCITSQMYQNSFEWSDGIENIGISKTMQMKTMEHSDHWIVTGWHECDAIRAHA